MKNLIFNKNEYSLNNNNFFISKLFNNFIKNNYQKYSFQHLYKNKYYHKFSTFPYYLWIPATFIFIIASVLLYIILFYFKIYSYLHTLIVILLYYLSFYIFSISKIEYVEIILDKQTKPNISNNKNNYIIHSYYNIFFSKVIKYYNIEDIKNIYIVKKGRNKNNIETSKFYLRIEFLSNNKIIDVCRTFNYNNIKTKYNICLIMILKKIIEDTPKYYFKDETLYGDYINNQDFNNLYYNILNN